MQRYDVANLYSQNVWKCLGVDSTYLPTMLAVAPVIDLLGFVFVDRVVVVDFCDLSAWPFM
jgi:hypothetical protein